MNEIKKCNICGRSEKQFRKSCVLGDEYFIDDNICDTCADEYTLFESIQAGELIRGTSNIFDDTWEEKFKDMYVDPNEYDYVMKKFKDLDKVRA